LNSTQHNPIIVALDFPTETEALNLVEQLGTGVGFYKIGLQLFTKYGPPIVERIKAVGAKVFLDLKFHDIPNTVKHSVISARELGVDMMTIHLSGGAKMIQAAVAGLGDSQALVLGVTVLTSSNRETLREIAVESEVADQVLRLAKLGVDSGLRGVVASPQEITLLRQALGDQLKIVTPGVRPAWAEANDQQRTMTPAEAIRAGADYLVIGRPITAQPDPKAATRRILEELQQAAS